MDKRPHKLLDNLIRSNISRARKDISQWRSALQTAENVDNPKRLLLYNIYDEVILDAHLTHEMNKRIGSLTGSDFNLIDQNGTPDIDAFNELNKGWFIKLMELAMESRFYGHSLVEINKLTDDFKIARVKLVPRRHVKPEFGMIVNGQNDEKGTIYRDNPQAEPWLFEFGDDRDLGLLNKSVPHVLFKRFAQSAWSEFSEIFGMPIRVGKTRTADANSLNDMEVMLRDMATAAYAIIDTDEEIEFIESSKSDGSVYEGLMKFSSSEISKLINGSVIGEADKGGSRAKEEIGKEVQEEINKADKKWFASIMNEMIIPKLINLGYNLANLTFEFEETKDIQAEWKIMNEVLNHYDVDPQFINDTFGIPVTAKKSANTINALAKKGFFE